MSNNNSININICILCSQAMYMEVWMSKFSKILAVLILILLVEILFIYKGYLKNKNSKTPTIEEINPHNYSAQVSVNYLF